MPLHQHQIDAIDELGHIRARAERYFGPVTSRASQVHRDKAQEARDWETAGRPDPVPVPDTYPILEDEAADQGITITELADSVLAKVQQARRVDKRLNRIYERHAALIRNATPVSDNPQFNVWIQQAEDLITAFLQSEGVL